MTYSHPYKYRKTMVSIGLYLVVIIWAIFTAFPLYWTVITSFKNPGTVYTKVPRFVPFVDYRPTIFAWNHVFGTKSAGEPEYQMEMMGEFALYFRNSLVASVISSLFAVFLGSLAAYALSRFRYRKWKNDDIAFFILAQRIFPPIVLAMPFFILFNFLHILDTLLGLVLVYTAMNLPLVVWLTKGFFADIPVEIEEAGLVDGCTPFASFIRIVVPLALPGLVVAFLFCFVFAWNEFLFALTLSFTNAKTLPVQVAGSITLRGPRYWDIAAQSLVIMIPPLLIALLANKYIIRGLTLGAIQ